MTGLQGARQVVKVIQSIAPAAKKRAHVVRQPQPAPDMRKALTALTFKMPSSRANQLVPKSSELLARVTPNMFVEGGALPLLVGNDVIGAIGASGAGGAVIGRQDELCAQAGLDKIKNELK